MSARLIADWALLGAIAGFCATLAMTAAMERMHQRLPAKQRYPLTPREITEAVRPTDGERGAATASLCAHFAYGAATGALFAVAAPRGAVRSGLLFGVACWTGSYLGWVPGLRIPRGATLSW